ncbi:hypothetical protein AQ490_06905 [Wenjunlia vitaminophila]|uniref:Roadblock/LAMTOR2 domain-containing protein n=1 Tax=Wenjunlia vitaminophila TaxID=76728 RepID=A0A0T6LP44_WENVI|nr:roadblock/LC7 domain-containing protein [Wenjunlia vitaminophila]KRV47615.1 hypothetical protein AQ490_06905 [Wenjunlia vitaminophila]
MTIDAHTFQSQTMSHLSWLLERFVEREPGTQSAFLASSDGILLAQANLPHNQAEAAAALVASMYSLARGVNQLTPQPHGHAQVLQVVTELNTTTLFLMVAGDGLPHGVRVQVGADASKVSSILGVLAAPDADVRAIGHQMTTMIRSVAEHLVTDARHIADESR